MQYRRIRQQSWESFAGDIVKFSIWRRVLRRRTVGRGMAGRLARPWRA
jgi:hypothetical protein